jgi:molybdenum cofactor cytidylyltransferase
VIAAILLAAGESTRMGQSKPLLPYDNTTLVEHLADELVRSRADEVIVVLGHEAERARSVLKGHPVRIVVNECYRDGMLSSVRCGLRALSPEVETVALAPVDQPGLTHMLVDAVLEARRESGKGIAVPLYGGRRGHPLVFAARYIPEILSDFDETGLRGLLPRHADDLLEVGVNDPAVLHDADTPEDYRTQSSRPT